MNAVVADLRAALELSVRAQESIEDGAPGEALVLLREQERRLTALLHGRLLIDREAA